MAKISFSTHILDTSSGTPGTGIRIDLYRQENDTFTHIYRNTTNEDGRSARFEIAVSAEGNTYKLRFDVGTYYKEKNIETLYPFVEVVFKTRDNGHYHIPLLVSPFGYSTYRGS